MYDAFHVHSIADAFMEDFNQKQEYWRILMLKQNPYPHIQVMISQKQSFNVKRLLHHQNFIIKTIYFHIQKYIQTWNLIEIVLIDCKMRSLLEFVLTIKQICLCVVREKDSLFMEYSEQHKNSNSNLCTIIGQCTHTST